MTRRDSSHHFCDFDSTRVTFTISGDVDSTRVTLRTMLTRHESRFLQNDSIRITISGLRLQSESFLQNLWAFDGQTWFVYTHRKKRAFFLLQWSRLAHIFAFHCQSCYATFEDKIFPTITETDLRLLFTERTAGHNTLSHYGGLVQNFHIMIMADVIGVTFFDSCSCSWESDSSSCSCSGAHWKFTRWLLFTLLKAESVLPHEVK